MTPLGLGREKSWNELLLARGAVRRDTEFMGVLSARVRGLDVPSETRMLSMAFLASAEAVAESAINPRAAEFSRFGCTLSTSKPNLLGYGNRVVFSEVYLQSGIGVQIARILRLGGEIMNVSAACATGAVSVITAARWIEEGVCDAVIAGAVECPFHPLYVAGFSKMGVLAKNAVRPFDAEREGFALGEGAGALVLERKDLAVLRGARIYGEVSGWGMSNDTRDAITFDGRGGSVALALKKALTMSGVKLPGYINAHGTGTALNDVMETKAYKKVFGARAKKVPVSSTKAATGHMLGASGAVEIAFSLLAMRDSAVPPTLNLVNPDPDCDLDYTPGKTAEKEVNSAVSVSFGFGGQTVAVCVKKI